MPSRRSFVLGGLAASLQIILPSSSWAKRKKLLDIVGQGPHLLAREDWPPAILISHMEFLDKGICCLVDQSGKLMLAAFDRGQGTGALHVLSELAGLGQEIIDCKIWRSKAYLLVAGAAEDQEQPEIITVDLQHASAPYIVSRTKLEKWTDANCLTAKDGMICAAGVNNAGEQTISIFSDMKNRQDTLTLLSQYATETPVYKMELANKHLLIVDAMKNSQLQCVSLSNPGSPQLQKLLPLNGDCQTMAAEGNIVVVCGYFAMSEEKDNNIAVKSIALQPTLHLVSQLPLDQLTSSSKIAATKERFIIVGDNADGPTIVSLKFDKLGVLSQDRESLPPRIKGPSGQSLCLAVKEKTAYVAHNGSDLAILQFGTAGWTIKDEYAIAKYSASSIASWQGNVVLAAGDLKLYDITQPRKPALVSTVDLYGTTKTIVGAGSFVLCLHKDSLALRKIETLNDIVASLKISGQDACFDQVQQKAYILANNHDKTALTKIQVYSNNLIVEAAQDLPLNYSQVCAYDGYLLLKGLNDLAFYRMNTEPELLGARRFTDLALRSIAMTKDNLFVSGVDHELKSSLLILAKDDRTLKTVGTVDLPNDGTAIAVSKRYIVVVGKSSDGKDLVSIIDYDKVDAPSMVASLPTVKDASAARIHDEIVIIGGRGLELLSLS